MHKSKVRKSFSSEQPWLGELRIFKRRRLWVQKKKSHHVFFCCCCCFSAPSVKWGLIPLGLLIPLHHFGPMKAVQSARKLYVPWSCFTLSEASVRLRIRAVSRSSNKCLQSTWKTKPMMLITTGAVPFHRIPLAVANGQEVVRRNFFLFLVAVRPF